MKFGGDGAKTHTDLSVRLERIPTRWWSRYAWLGRTQGRGKSVRDRGAKFPSNLSRIPSETDEKTGMTHSSESSLYAPVADGKDDSPRIIPFRQGTKMKIKNQATKVNGPIVLVLWLTM